MKKVVVSVLWLVISTQFIFSQFDVQISQYMFHNSAYNPAAVGEDDMIQITGQHRIQWLGIPNAGQTTVFSINSPLKTGTSLNGIGLKFLNETVGKFTNQSAHLQYAYKRKLGIGKLSVGADIGFVSLGFRGDSTYIPVSDYHVSSSQDLQIPKTVGLFYSTSKYYGGLSYSHLNSPTVNWDDNIDFNIKGTLYLSGGYNWILPDSKYVLKPTTLLKSDFNSLQLDVSARLEYDNKYWGGLSYRIQDAIVILAGINVAGGFALGYAYDLPTSEIITVSSGSHEILLTYNFEYIVGKKTNKFKSIRIL